MGQFFSLIHTAMFCGTLLGVAFIVAMAVPESKMPSLVLPAAKWCVAAIKAAMAKKPNGR
ncbi:MAG TPA: hypothetical protein PK867_25985 [Pirellulales bacterium]|nr:hypothetical protein [Pirellulales bacterium]